MNLEEALGIVRLMIDRGIGTDVAINNPAIPEEFREQIRQILKEEETILLRPVRMVTVDQLRGEWLRDIDRSSWYYWLMLREYLIGMKGWDSSSIVRSLDEATDRILGQLAPPSTDQFDIRGLVLGYVQSGKTANYSGLIAKAADTGYRLFIILSGIDNGLRRQTQIRLDHELVGYADNPPGAIILPPRGRQWHQFTTEAFDGDFRPGYANYAALQGTEPVLLVVKKNSRVLQRLHNWLDAAPDETKSSLPVLIIDDEADLASIDTRGSYQQEDGPLPDDYEEPSVINGKIRELLTMFHRISYVAYTATPFANILIPHDTYDPTKENDLYPKDFIIDLPKPNGYFGAEELFGRLDDAAGEETGGMDVVRDIPYDDLDELLQGNIPQSLRNAIMDFVLAGAAKAARGQANAPATMLVHVSQFILQQMGTSAMVNQIFSELRDEWRYQRTLGIQDRLKQRWENEFHPVTTSISPERIQTFEELLTCIGPFLESVQVRTINSFTGEVLDYERELGLKAIAIGGNRLSRGLTLEGLIVSYFARRSATYDTLMQMGRWFGFRSGYEDLTRIYITPELARWLSDLALVEYQLRQDIERYEAEDLTPLQLGSRILAHPAMLVTSRLKQRQATRITVEQNYAEQLQQTFWFPFERPNDLRELLERNMLYTREFLQNLGDPSRWTDDGPIWNEIGSTMILEFLQNYHVDWGATNISLPLICNYIERQNELDYPQELQNWTVAIKGRGSPDARLGECDITVPGGVIYPVRRTRLTGNPNSLGVITSPGDEEEGLSEEQLGMARGLVESGRYDRNRAARHIRDATDGLLLIYPISRYSGYNLPHGGRRQQLYDDPESPMANGIIGLALSFPRSERAQSIRGEYVVGTVGWRPL